MAVQPSGGDSILVDPSVKVGPNYKWYVIAMLWFIAFFNYADRIALASVFPLIEEEMGLSKTQLGTLGAAFSWLYGLAAPLAGMIVDRTSRKNAILFGLHVWSVICMATALSKNFTHLLMFRAAEGLGETFYFPASMSLVSDFHGKKTRSRAMSFHQTSVYVGTIAGGFFAGLIGQHYGWRWSFIVFGGMGVILGIVLHFILHEPRRGASERADVGAGASHGVSTSGKLSFMEFVGLIRTTPTLQVLLGAFMCANFVALVLLTWMPSYLNQNFGMSLAMAGLGATLFVQIASMCAAPLGGYLADTLRARTPGGRMIVQMVGVFGGAPFVLLCGMTQSVTWLIVALTFWGFFKGLYDANIFAAVYDVVRPEARGTAAGFMNAIGWLAGGGSAPIVIGIIADRTNLGFAIATASIVYVAAGLLLLLGITRFVRRDNERMQAAVIQS